MFEHWVHPTFLFSKKGRLDLETEFQVMPLRDYDKMKLFYDERNFWISALGLLAWTAAWRLEVLARRRKQLEEAVRTTSSELVEYGLGLRWWENWDIGWIFENTWEYMIGADLWKDSKWNPQLICVVSQILPEFSGFDILAVIAIDDKGF